MRPMKIRRAVVVALVAVLLPACGGRQDRLSYASLESAGVGREMAYGVYTPPDWDGRQPLPLVLFLHGAGDDERCWDRHGSFQELDEWINAGRLPPFLMAVPEGELGFWANWYDGTFRYEDYVLEEVLPAVRERYPTLPGRENTHLAGISMGGTGAMYTFLGHKQRFASAAIISAPLFDVDSTMGFLSSFLFRVFARGQRIFGPPERQRVEAANIYPRVTSAADLEGARLLIANTDDDERSVRTWSRRYHEHLRDHGVPHRYATFPGKHRWTAWRPALPRMLCLQLAGADCELPPMAGWQLDEVEGG